jgi:2-oxoisovalerate dehydrogenase E2 component (dihydrolipoyl transacylase)
MNFIKKEKLVLKSLKMNRILTLRGLLAGRPVRAFVPQVMTQQWQLRHFHVSLMAQKRIPFLLADIGEGITECELVQWCVLSSAGSFHGQ